MLSHATPIEEVKPAKILIIDDDQSMRDLLFTILKDDYLVVTVNGALPGLEIVKHQDFDVILLDIMLGDGNGIDVLKQIKQFNEKTEIIMITVIRDLRTAVDAIKNGAFDYITKNFEYNDVKHIIQKAIAQGRLKGENLSLKTEIGQYTQINYVEGQNPKMTELNQVITRIAKMPSNVLIQGESGTGKEIVARRIHNLGSQQEDGIYRPFISVNVASIPSELLESTLFGHEKGSFTGAVKTHRGKFELAHGGTLFLDEIGELRLELQAKLLRAIQEREIERLGGEHPISVDVRIIAATNQDLLRRVKEGQFREDLYYRLNVIPIRLPALRERIEDLPEFVNLFISKYSQRLYKKVTSATQRVIECLQEYSWPGNIRELENVIERIVALSTTDTIVEDDLPIELRFFESHEKNSGIEYEEILKQATSAFEKRYILSALNKYGWNQVKTAEALGIHRKTLEYKIKKLNLQNIIEIKRSLLRQGN